MTKTLTGAAAQILIDDGKLRLTDRAADYLPGFQNEKSRNITIEHLLTHFSGLPLTILNGFDESLTGPEDWDFDRRVKELGKTDIINMPLLHNEGHFRLKPYLAKKSYYAGSFDSYINKWGPEDIIIKKQLGLTYRFFGVFFEHGKWKKLILHPVLTLGMYFLRGLVGAAFLLQKLKKFNKAA